MKIYLALLLSIIAAALALTSLVDLAYLAVRPLLSDPSFGAVEVALSAGAQAILAGVLVKVSGKLLGS